MFNFFGTKKNNNSDKLHNDFITKLLLMHQKLMKIAVELLKYYLKLDNKRHEYTNSAIRAERNFITLYLEIYKTDSMLKGRNFLNTVNSIAEEHKKFQSKEYIPSYRG